MRLLLRYIRRGFDYRALVTYIPNPPTLHALLVLPIRVLLYFQISPALGASFQTKHTVPPHSISGGFRRSLISDLRLFSSRRLRFSDRGTFVTIRSFSGVFNSISFSRKRSKALASFCP